MRQLACLVSELNDEQLQIVIHDLATYNDGRKAPALAPFLAARAVERATSPDVLALGRDDAGDP